jgi:hypothetical protein
VGALGAGGTLTPRLAVIQTGASAGRRMVQVDGKSTNLAADNPDRTVGIAYQP